ncbi:hypothetical protein D3C71_1324580 [compost metagenome]
MSSWVLLASVAVAVSRPIIQDFPVTPSAVPMALVCAAASICCGSVPMLSPSKDGKPEDSTRMLQVAQ